MAEAMNCSVHSCCAGVTAVITGLNDHRRLAARLQNHDPPGVAMYMFISWCIVHEWTKADEAFLVVEIELTCKGKRFARLMFPRSQCNRSVGMRRQITWSSLLGATFTSEDASETISWSGHLSRHCHLLHGGTVFMPPAGLALCTHSWPMVCLFLVRGSIWVLSCPHDTTTST